MAPPRLQVSVAVGVMEGCAGLKQQVWVAELVVVLCLQAASRADADSEAAVSVTASEAGN